MKRKEEALPYTGKVFVVTGTTVMPREDIIQRIRDLGGRVTLSISGATTYLVAGADPGPSKIKKAKDAGTKVITEKEFIEMTKNYVIQPPAIKKPKREENKGKHKWIDKYKPSSIEKIIGNMQAAQKVKAYLHSPTGSSLVISGPSGIGKTLSVYLAAKELGVTIVEYDGSMQRNKAEMQNLTALSTQQTLCGPEKKEKKKVILMEDIESMGADDRGGLAEILPLISRTKVPIIITINNKTDPKLKGIIAKSNVIVFHKIDTRAIVGMFKRIIAEEKIEIGENTLIQIAAVCGGDIRYAINALECLCKKNSISSDEIKTLGKISTSQTIFDTTKDIFLPSLPIEKKMKAYYTDPLLSLLMVFENYLEGTVVSAAEISDALSRAENISTRIFYHGEKSLFSISAYHTVVKPKLRLSTRINFPKYLGFSSSRDSKRLKYSKMLSHMAATNLFGGWSTIYTLFFVISYLANKNNSLENRNILIKELGIDKDDLLYISAITETKVSTAGLTMYHRKNH